MGTSKSFGTPKGGSWTPLKNDITDYLGNGSDISVERIVGRTVSTTGLGLSALRSNTGVGRGGGGGSGTAGGRSGSGAVSAARAVGGAVAGLAGFGSTIRRQGLEEALNRLGLADLRGRPAAEVLARIAEKLATEADGPQKEVIQAAILEVLFEAAEIEGPEGYEDLQESLQKFLERDGIDGLVESFLTRCVYDGIWFVIEQHIGVKSANNSDVKTMALAMEAVCRSEVLALMEERRNVGVFEATDWFGSDGQELAQEIVHELENRLRGLEEEK